MPEILRRIDASLTGCDGSGKDTAVAGALDILFDSFRSGELRVLRLDRPPMYVWQDADGIKQTKKLFLIPFMIINLLHQKGDRENNFRLVETANAMNVLIQGRIVRKITERQLNPNLYFGSRNYFTDPAAYAQFYSPELQSLNIHKRLKFMKRISGLPDYNQIFFMQVNPQRALERIDSRTEEERIKPTGQPAWRHRHETLEGLTALSDTFSNMPPVVKELFPNTEVIVVDASNSKEKVAEFIANNINRAMVTNTTQVECSKIHT